MNSKHSFQGLQLLRQLVGVKGLNIFSTNQARQAAKEINIKANYVTEALYHLQKEKWVWRLKRGFYAVCADSGMGKAPHEFEIAMTLVTPCVISHWTALHFHHLTQQIPNTIFAMTPTGTSIPRSVPKEKYHYVQIKPEHYFGIEKVWIEQSQVQITDVERSLLDGLMAPQHCGDFQEVLHAFKLAQSKMNVEKITHYALLLDIAVVKRLGWILEKLGYEEAALAQLFALPIKGYRRLDPTRPPEGPYNKKWMIHENI